MFFNSLLIKYTMINFDKLVVNLLFQPFNLLIDYQITI